MTLTEALAELGLQPGADAETVRRTYLRLIKTRKPESDPEGFRRAREALPNTTAMARADSLFIELTGIPRELLGQAIAVFRGALDAQDPDPIADARRRLLALVEDIEQGRMRPPG